MPQVRFRDAGNTLRTCARIRMRDVGNTLRQIQRIRMRDAGNVLRTVWQFFSVALSASIVTGSNSGAASSGTVTSSSVTGTPTGGTAPYTYAWQYVSGDATVAPTSPTAATTTFSSTTVTELGKIAFFQLQVTDNVGNVVTSSVLEVQLYWSDTR